MNTRILFLTIFMTLSFSAVFAQNTDKDQAANGEGLNVFLDCDFCDSSFIRREITFVNYALDRRDADLHVIITRQSTGGGGRLFSFDFIGQADFAGQSDRLTASTLPNDSEDRERNLMTQTLKAGLIRYVAQTPLIDQLEISYDEPTQSNENGPQNGSDKWNKWVFRVSGSGEYRAETSQERFNWRANFEASRVSDLWKTSFSASTRQNETTYTLDDTTIVSTSDRYNAYGRVVRSLSNHWSVKLSSYYNSSTYSNIDGSVSLSPGIEYSFFPYAESNRKFVTLRYELTFETVDYTELTLYDKTSENLLQQELSLGVDLTQPWGSAGLSLTGSTYLHDFSKNNISLNAGLDIRITRGLSLDISGGVSQVRDQLSLPAEGATEQEILLRQKEIATDFEFDIEIGLSYRFGALFNNIVNPRFDNRVGFFRF